MRAQAMAEGVQQNVSYRDALAHATGLPNECANLVCRSQSLHRMTSQGTYEESARILVNGGIVAACVDDWPPMTGQWRADLAFELCLARICKLEAELRQTGRPQRWSNGEHLARMQNSG